MKTKTAKGTKRFLSAVLAFAMTAGLIPLPAHAADTAVSYNRREPEIAILNSESGQSSKLYAEIAKDGAQYPWYNAIGLYGKTISDRAVDKATWEYDYGDFSSSTMKDLIGVRGNMQVNVAATFYNRWHDHTHKKGIYKYTSTVPSYEGMTYSIGGEEAYWLFGSMDIYREFVRVGEFGMGQDDYKSLRLSDANDGGKFEFDKSRFPYKDFEYRTCTCGGAYAEKLALTFRDMRAPSLEAVEYSTDGGKTWQDRKSRLYVKAGGTLLIRLTCDEPIRFADDRADHKLSIALQASGSTDMSRRAELIELNDRSMIFSYTAEDDGKVHKIETLNTAELFGSSLKLVQLKGGYNGGGTFSIDSSFKNSAGSTDGLSTTTSYITDLAGNPLRESNIAGANLVLDAEQPHVARVQFDLGLNNADVKAALNKTDKSDTNYTDGSDLFLGVGDTMTLRLQMNERLVIPSGADKWNKATATTNIKRADGSYVTAESYTYSPASERDTSATTLYMEPISIEEGMTVSGSEIMVTELNISEPVCDLAGNEYTAVQVPAENNRNRPLLDVLPPAVTNESPVPKGKGVVCHVRILDTNPETMEGESTGADASTMTYSGVRDISGSFTLNQTGDGRGYKYKWAITVDASTEPEWVESDAAHKVTLGTPQSFKQHEDFYLHLAPADDETYGDLSGCTLTFRVKDYAGNSSEQMIDLEDWYIDGIAPAIKAGSSSRVLDSGTGTLTAEVTLSDQHGISAWWYAWTDDDTTPPDEGDWQEGEGPATSDDTLLRKTAAAEVSSGERFSRYLWIRALDNAQTKDNSMDVRNKSERCLGQYGYDLSNTEYELSYSDDLAMTADVKVTSLDKDGTLVFMVPVPENIAGDSEHYAVLALTNPPDDAGSQDINDKWWIGSGKNLFLMNNGDGENAHYYNSWYYMQAEKDAKGNYTFDAEVNEDTQRPPTIDTCGDAAVKRWWENIQDSAYQGELKVIVLTGQKTAIERWPVDGETEVNYYRYAPKSAGNGEQAVTESAFTLRLMGDDGVDNYENVSLTTDRDNSGLLKTPLNTAYTIKIGKDASGFRYEDVDTDGSFVLLTNVTTHEEYRLPLGTLNILEDGSVSQTVPVPERDFKSGKYTAALYLASACGKRAHQENCEKALYVDMTEPSDDFALTSIRFAPIRKGITAGGGSLDNPFGLADTYGTRLITAPTAEDDNGQISVYELPISQGYESLGYDTVSDAEQTMSRYWITAESIEGQSVTSIGDGRKAGAYQFLMWNTEYPDETIMLEPADGEGKVLDNTYTYSYNGEERTVCTEGFTFSREGLTKGKHLYLKPNESNIVAMQRVYDNGGKSSIKYAAIRPMTDTIDGTLHIDQTNKQLVFTPAEGTLTAGAQVFAWVYQHGQNEGNAEGKRIEMEQQGGTWVCSLVPNGAIYRVVTESASGSLCVVGDTLSQTAPGVTADGIQLTDNGNGTYTLGFSVYDDRDTLYQDGVDANIELRMLDADGGTVLEAAKSFSTKEEPDSNYSWTPDSAEASGVYEIKTAKLSSDYDFDYMNVSLNGVYPEGTASAVVTVTLTDGYGNTGTSTVQTAAPTGYKVPTAVPGRANNGGLPVEFDQPVRPVESWAWHEGDASSTGFKTSWEAGSFPVAGNGTHEITFRDIFGIDHTQEITVDSFNWNLKLGFSTTDPTRDPVTITAEVDTGTAAVWLVDQETGTQTTIPDKNHKIYAQQHEYEFDRNVKMMLAGYEGEDIHSARRFQLRVYVDNITSGAPDAELHYYVTALGREFTAEELDNYISSSDGALTVSGNVRVWYTTGRYVTPTDDTGSEFLFTPENQNEAHTFTYRDALDQDGSVTAELPAGLLLEAPAVPPEDNTPPVVSVDIYVKRGGVYTREESLLPTDTTEAVEEKFRNLSYVQGYSFVIKAIDDSGYSIEAEGAALSGNTLVIDKAGTYTITVKDKSPKENETGLTIIVPAYIDNEPPTGTVKIVPTSVYAKTLYLTLKDNSGEPVILTAPLGLTPDANGVYKYVLTDNGTTNFAFRDEAGNQGTASYTAVGIDNTPPTLTVRWSPSWGMTDEDGRPDDSHPTSETVNTSITAHIESSKAMQTLAFRADNEAEDAAHLLLTDGIAGAPYEIAGQNGKVLVRITAKPDRVTVTYFENYDQPLHFTAMAPNGKSSTATLDGIGRIDKTAPSIAQNQKDICRSGYSVPAKVEVTLEPDEWVTSSNYGETETIGEDSMPVQYGPGYPLVLTFTENGTYGVRFADQAGNLTIEQVKITGIDSEPPVLAVSDMTGGGQNVSVNVEVSEPCTLTWGTNGTYTAGAAGTHTLTFTENGTYVITAADHAGNQSIKTVRIGNIDAIPPHISFTNNTIHLLAGSSADVLNAELVKGCTVWDNLTPPDALRIVTDTAEVDLNTAGQYTVNYTVTDAAGNTAEATRLVRIFGADTVYLEVDGKLNLPDSTAVLRPGTHTLTVQNNTEPYSIKAQKGIRSTGQMKYLNGSSLTFDADGKFTVTDTGYYTVLVTTQSRETIRLLLYVEW